MGEEVTRQVIAPMMALVSMSKKIKEIKQKLNKALFVNSGNKVVFK